MEKEFKGIIFDIDGTLYYHWPVRIIVFLNIVFAYCFNPVELFRVLKTIASYRRMQENLRRLGIPIRSLADMQLSMAAKDTGETIEFVRQTVERWMMERPLLFLKFFLRAGLLEFILMAKQHGMKLGIYSDYPAVKKLQSMKIAHYFSAIVSSFDRDVLTLKPNPEGFLLCATKLGLNPEDILFIGDRAIVDGIGAENSGMQVFLVHSLARLKPLPCKYEQFTSFHSLGKALFDLKSL